MITRELIQQLHCPGCGDGLTLEPDASPASRGVRWGVAACGCCAYPVLDGILVLEQGPAMPREFLERSVAALRAGNHAAALGWAARASDLCRRGILVRAASALIRLAHPKAAERYGQRVDPVALLDRSLSFEQLAYLTRPVDFARYLVQRFANPSLMAAAVAIMAMGQRSRGDRPLRILDLGAGAGHTAFLMRRLAPNVEPILADCDVVSLCLARRILGPDATLIALDAQAPLPFPDGWFDGIFSLDAVHYIPSKVALVAELRRTVRPASLGGFWALMHLHNAERHNPVPGIPLSLTGYRRILQGDDVRIQAESTVLRRYVAHAEFDAAADDPAAAEANALCVFAGAAAHWGRVDLSRVEMGSLDVNPVYGREQAGGTVRLRRRWVSARLRTECAGAEWCLPEAVEVPAKLLAAAQTGLHNGLGDQIARLARSFVLVPLPDRYLRRHLAPEPEAAAVPLRGLSSAQ